MKKSTTIRIEELYGDYATTISTHRTTDIDEAIERAIQKRYGKKAHFVEDRSLRTGDFNSNHAIRYGKAFRDIPNTCSMENITWRLQVSLID